MLCDFYCKGEFRSPERVTFGRCSKSDQKNNQKPRFLDFLHAVLHCIFTPFYHATAKVPGIVLYDVSTFFLRRCRSQVQG